MYRGNRLGFDTVRRRGMTEDFSWNRSAGPTGAFTKIYHGGTTK